MSSAVSPGALHVLRGSISSTIYVRRASLDTFETMANRLKALAVDSMKLQTQAMTYQREYLTRAERPLVTGSENECCSYSMYCQPHIYIYIDCQPPLATNEFGLSASQHHPPPLHPTPKKAVMPVYSLIKHTKPIPYIHIPITSSKRPCSPPVGKS